VKPAEPAAKPLTKRHAVLLAALTEAAARNAKCPDNADLARLIGLEKPHSVLPYLKFLEDQGLILQQRYQMAKQVTIVATGAKTFVQPSRQVPHWRDREGGREDEGRPLSAAKVAERNAPERCNPRGKQAEAGFQPALVTPCQRGADGLPLVPPFEPFTPEQEAIFAESLAEEFSIETAARHARRSLLDGYRQFHRMAEQLGEAAA
jgi:hypothetical protein